ncbi:MAG: 3-isopropylmalate dehydratase small subunit [Chloroflexota bacterium]
MTMRGRVWKYGDNVDTDAIIPARYLNTSSSEELARHCMEDIDATFASQVKPGDIVVAGANFGCGSSREHAPVALKAAGVECVIASSFARIFYRNAINIGLPILECPEASKHVEANQELDVELGKGIIWNLSSGRVFRAAAFPSFMLAIIEAGGLVEYTRQRLHNSLADHE